MANEMIPNEAMPKTPEALSHIINRAQKGDTTTLPVLRRLLQEPGTIEMFGGDLAQQMERHLIEQAAGKNLAFKESLLRKVELMRQELAGPSPTPLERLLVERIVTCWLHLHERQLRFVHNNDLTINQADYWQRALDHCHRRYLTAIKTLATIRKMALPVLQVNIAKKQVNIGQAQVNSAGES